MDDQLRAVFAQGVEEFKQGRYGDALEHVQDVLLAVGPVQRVLEARSAIFEKVDMLPEALSDAKLEIEMYPRSSLGYARAARLFLRVGRLEHAEKMAAMARERVTGHPARIKQLNGLDREIADAIRERNAPTIDDVPSEVLVRIFLLLHRRAYDPRPMLKLSLVCRRWRDIILNTSTIWRTARLHPRAALKQFEIWTERTSVYPELRAIMHLELRKDFIKGACSQIIERWSKSPRFIHEPLLPVSLALGGVDDELLKAPTSYGIDKTELHLNSIPAGLVDLTIQHTRGVDFTRFPNLRHLRSSYTDIPALFGVSRLVTLHLGSIDLDRTGKAMQEVLEANGATLQSLRLSFSRLTNSDRNSSMLDEVLNLPELTELMVQNPSQTASLHLFRTPCLQHLTLENFNRIIFDRVIGHLFDNNDPAEPLPLKALRFLKCVFEKPIEPTVFTRLDHLEDLAVTNCGQELNQMIRFIAGTRHSATGSDKVLPLLCPRLRVVDFSDGLVTASPFRDLVAARISHTSNVQPQVSVASDMEGQVTSGLVVPLPIQKITIDNCPSVDHNILPWLRETCIVMCKYETRMTARERMPRSI